MDVTVCVSTFGGQEWKELANQRAIPSAQKLGCNVIQSHAESLHEARNQGLNCVTTEYVCFLDADDELEASYFDKMAESAADIRVPSVRYVRNGFDQGVRMPKISGHSHVCTPDCLAEGNYIVIGAVAPTQLLRDVGGFRDFAWSEDYDLWVRCWQAGATFENVPRAVYRAHVRRDSRNRGPSAETKLAVHQAIARANGLTVPVG